MARLRSSSHEDLSGVSSPSRTIVSHPIDAAACAERSGMSDLGTRPKTRSIELVGADKAIA
jgi:hypothetical protein